MSKVSAVTYAELYKCSYSSWISNNHHLIQVIRLINVQPSVKWTFFSNGALRYKWMSRTEAAF